MRGCHHQPKLHAPWLDSVLYLTQISTYEYFASSCEAGYFKQGCRSWSCELISDNEMGELGVRVGVAVVSDSSRYTLLQFQDKVGSDSVFQASRLYSSGK